MMNAKYIDPTNKPLDKDIASAPIGKRFMAFILDLLCLFIFSTFLNSTLVSSLQKNFYNQESYKAEVKERLLSTHLYQEDEENDDTYYFIYNMYELDEINDEKKEEYYLLLETNLNLLITEGNFSCYTEDNFVDYKKEATFVAKNTETNKDETLKVFDFNQETNQFEYNSRVTLNDKIEFYQGAHQNAYDIIISQDEILVEASKKLNNISMIEIIGSLSFVGIILFLIIPLCSKKGQTLGKMMYGIAVVEKNDKPIRKTTILLRYLILYYIEILLSIFFYGLPLLISLTIMCFGKKQQSVHDLILSTKVIMRDDYPSEEIIIEEQGGNNGGNN